MKINTILMPCYQFYNCESGARPILMTLFYTFRSCLHWRIYDLTRWPYKGTAIINQYIAVYEKYNCRIKLINLCIRWLWNQNLHMKKRTCIFVNSTFEKCWNFLSTTKNPWCQVIFKDFGKSFRMRTFQTQLYVKWDLQNVTCEFYLSEVSKYVLKSFPVSTHTQGKSIQEEDHTWNFWKLHLHKNTWQLTVEIKHILVDNVQWYCQKFQIYNTGKHKLKKAYTLVKFVEQHFCISQNSKNTWENTLERNHSTEVCELIFLFNADSNNFC